MGKIEYKVVVDTAIGGFGILKCSRGKREEHKNQNYLDLPI